MEEEKIEPVTPVTPKPKEEEEEAEPGPAAVTHAAAATHAAAEPGPNASTTGAEAAAAEPGPKASTTGAVTTGAELGTTPVTTGAELGTTPVTPGADTSTTSPTSSTTSGFQNENPIQSPGAVAQRVANSSSSGIRGSQDQSTDRIQDQKSISGNFGSINFTIGTSSAENDFLKEMLECQMKINKEGGGQISMDEFFRKLHDCEIQNITKHKISNGFSGLIEKYNESTLTLDSTQVELITSLTSICGDGNSGFDNSTLNSSEFLQYINTCVQNNPNSKDQIKTSINNYLNTNPN